MDQSKLKILIVDDHPFFRQGVKFFLSSIPDFEIVGEAASGEEAINAIASYDLDVILMDLKMNGMDGISTAEAMLKQNPNLRILILTSFGNMDSIHQALATGAAGYCLKDAPPEELATAIRAVADGGTYLGRGITPQALAKAANATSEGNNSNNTNNVGNNHKLIEALTQRELDVLELLGQGLGNKEIAQQLVVSEKTVKTHVANILQKLNVKTRTQAALLASSYVPRQEG
ncbi:MAG: response regulator transcription factor [Bacillota bacterium]|nr:response regulator transcription factor [Bacillota bacterium]